MTVNDILSDKSVGVPGAGRDKKAVSDVTTNGNGVHKVQLDTYFADERIHVPEKVSAVRSLINKPLIIMS